MEELSCSRSELPLQHLRDSFSFLFACTSTLDLRPPDQEVNPTPLQIKFVLETLQLCRLSELQLSSLCVPCKKLAYNVLIHVTKYVAVKVIGHLLPSVRDCLSRAHDQTIISPS
jgi:hypothetical protein